MNARREQQARNRDFEQSVGLRVPYSSYRPAWEEPPMEKLRHHLRTVVNVAALVAAILAVPEVVGVIPQAWMPVIGGIVAGANTVLSWLRGKV